mgnify:CR=1 FL=1
MNKMKRCTKSMYVAWIDIMGSGILMRTSLNLTWTAANCLHTSVLSARSSSVMSFPMNDGVFLASTAFYDLRDSIVSVYRNIHIHNSEIVQQQTRWPAKLARSIILPRASIAYGPTVYSTNHTAAEDYTAGDQYGHIILGPSVSNAYSYESNVGPFGIFMHESARMHGERRYRASFIRYGTADKGLTKSIIPLLRRYFDVAERHSNELEYEVERQRHHRALCREYFEEVDL